MQVVVTRVGPEANRFDEADVFLHERPRVEVGGFEERHDVPQRLRVADVDVRFGGREAEKTETLRATQQLLVLKIGHQITNHHVHKIVGLFNKC